ncbi:unnamed protein product [Miscanthus lutarioriparius]|uniref:Pectinesterase inhibitor domain-containing protein n=1 Tax=Miscanthus lutarioriparius TaxID=422564 RepID=A0A811RAT0_9POAL|nr:unnamed protein product [Miscanthus lutarioriparius]
MAAGSSSCSPILLLLLFLASAGADTGEASLSTSAPAPAPAPAQDQDHHAPRRGRRRALLLRYGGAAAADTVADSCDAIRDFVDVAFCASRLGSVPGAASADRHGHLLMAADVAAASGTRWRRAASCTGARRAASWARARPRGTLWRRAASSHAAAWGAARALLPLTGQAGIGCDAALAGSAPAKARMAAANREFDQLSTMATALLNELT